MPREAARLAGVSEILLAVGADTEAANLLGVCRDVVEQANDRLAANRYAVASLSSNRLTSPTLVWRRGRF
jgi:hypothetical protein